MNFVKFDLDLIKVFRDLRDQNQMIFLFSDKTVIHRHVILCNIEKQTPILPFPDFKQAAKTGYNLNIII